MKALLISAAIVIIAMMTPKDKLTGRWQTQPSENGNVTSVLFRTDNTFEGFVNKKSFATGEYNLQDSIFSFVDNGCNGQRGVYKVVFFNNDDSLRLVPLVDKCEERKNGISRMVLGKVK
ncbi:MAG: hypothetical protein ABI480_07570 [Chitinophagaceae bacterium]